MDKETALRMARKLAAINNNNATEAEALLAAEHLARISREHGFTRLDWTPEQIKAGVKSEKTRVDNDRRANMPKYVKWTISQVCKSFNVEAVLIGAMDVDFIGDETAITLVKFFLEELLRVIPKLRWKAKCDMRVEGQDRAWKESWELGFIHAVGDRLDKIMNEMSSELQTRCRALVLVTREMIEAEKDRKYPGCKQVSVRPKGHDRDAYSRGQSDGKKQQLQANIG